MTFDSMRLSHAYITDGEAVMSLAMAAVCSSDPGKTPCRNCTHCDKAGRSIHPDITTINRLDEKREIFVDQIRWVRQDAYTKPNDAAKKVYIINDADKMNHNAQNAFLQILEEPPSHAVFILKTPNPTALLPTVYSRCVDLKTQPDAKTDTEPEADENLKALMLKYLSALSDNLKLTRLMYEFDKLNRVEFLSFIDLTKEQIVVNLRKDPHDNSLSLAYDVLTKAGEMLDLNVSAGHVAGYICASFIE